MNKPLSENSNLFHTLHVPADSLHFNVSFDLSYFINSWKNLDTTQLPMMKVLQEEVLREWEVRTDLHGKHKDNSAFKGHEDFLKMLLSIKFSLDNMHSKNSMMGAFMPVTLDSIWTTPSLMQLQTDAVLDPTEMIERRNIALIHIFLHRLYGNKFDLSKLPRSNGDIFSKTIYHQSDPNGPIKYYSVRVDNEMYLTNSWSIGLELNASPPELTQEDIDKILVHPFDLKYLLSIFDPSCITFSGCLLITAVDITQQHQVFLIHKRLSQENALRTIHDLNDFEQQLQTHMKIPDLQVGLLLSPFTKESRRARWTPFHRSLRFKEGIDPGSLDEEDSYIKAWSRPQIINQLLPTDNLSSLEKKGVQSIYICPLFIEGVFIGLLEVASLQPHVFDYQNITNINAIAEVLAKTIKTVHEREHERLMAVIKQTCTAIHPTVEWRFQEMARNYLTQLERDEIPQPEEVVFKKVIPIFGVSDIRGSSKNRNEAIKNDLLTQLQLCSNIIETASRLHPRPVFNELLFRIEKNRNKINAGLNSGDEVRIYGFLDYVVDSTFQKLNTLCPEIRTLVKHYENSIDPELGIVYRDRKSYDESVTLINETISTYLDRQQEVAQKVVPHYFEKYKTDGVDYNIYVGNSLLEEEICCPIDLRDLYLWQLMTMCGIVWLMNDLKPTMKVPLDTAHLILVQSTPLNISFQMEEKHFNVDGAYNARYEIVKKRIDKAKIEKTGERLTQPGHIAIVYTQEQEAFMYKEFINYLNNLGFIEEEYIDVLLEDLQGVHGLRAIRVRVKDTPPSGWDPKNPKTSLGIV